MTKNVATWDRIVRILFAVVVGALWFTGTLSGTWGIVLGVLAAVFLVTGLVGFCPLYAIFKLSTLKA